LVKGLKKGEGGSDRGKWRRNGGEVDDALSNVKRGTGKRVMELGGGKGCRSIQDKRGKADS